MKKNVILYILSLIACFLLGLGVTLGLHIFDNQQITPLQGGLTHDLSEYGFTMRIPENAIIRDHTQENYESGGDALYAGSITTEEDGVLYVFCYENAAHDSLESYPEQEVITHYMSAGATDVRTRMFGGRRFICYRTAIIGTDGEQLWDTYECWDESLQITFETRMAPRVVLPILATIAFTDAQ